MKVDVQFTVQKDPEEERNSQKGTHNPFLIIISYHFLFPASSTTTSTSTGTKTLYANIVKSTGYKSQPPMKIKTETSDEESIYSEIAQDPFLLKCTKIMITDPQYTKEVQYQTRT